MTVRNIIPEYKDPEERMERLQNAYKGLQKNLLRKQDAGKLPEKVSVK